MRIAALVALCVVSFVSTACITKPVETAQTVDQKAFAVYGEFVVFEETAVAVVKDPATPTSVKSAIKTADAKAKPVMDSLLSAEILVSSIRKQLAAGTNTQAKLDIAVADLASWVQKGTPVVNDLVTAVKGGVK